MSEKHLTDRHKEIITIIYKKKAFIQSSAMARADTVSQTRRHRIKSTIN